MKRLFVALTLLAVSFPVSALARDKAVQPEPAKIVERGSACLSINLGRSPEGYRIVPMVREHMKKFVDVVPTPLQPPSTTCSLSADTYWAFQVTVYILTTFEGPEGSSATFKIMSVEIRDRQDNVRIGRPDDAYDTDMYDHMTQAFIRALQAEPAHQPR